MNRPHFSRNRRFRGPRIRINERIRAREVRVVDSSGKQLGVFSRHDAISMARERQVDLVEIAENASPPVCRLVDFGKYQYEQSKKKKENKKNQHANKTKEVQLSVKIDPHDLQTKQNHAIDFLCEDMKVKVTLRFRGRENAHKEVGFEVVQQFVNDLGAWGHPDAPTRKIGRGLIVMITPLPRNQRSPHPGHEKTALLDEIAADSEKPQPKAVPVSKKPPPLEPEESLAEPTTAPETEQKTTKPLWETPPLIPTEETEPQTPPAVTEETAAMPLLPVPVQLEPLLVPEETPQLPGEEAPPETIPASEKLPLLESEEPTAETAKPALPQEIEPSIVEEPLTAPKPEAPIAEELAKEPEDEKNDAEQSQK